LIAISQGLCLLAAIPDDKQQDRINTIMMHSRPDEGDGILIQAQQCSDDQQEGFEKCVHFLHEIRRQRAVAKWLDQHRSHWSWMEPENGPEMNPQQSRGDHSVRRGGNRHQNMSDDDDDFDDDDDDEPYCFDPRENEHEEMIVSGCGIPDINGRYKKIGHCDEVPKYSKTGRWEGKEEDFMLFRCKLSDNTRRWYISIVPGNSKYWMEH
jgi:ubiquitin carboxyl-terminal hydrolase 9/24